MGDYFMFVLILLKSSLALAAEPEKPIIVDLVELSDIGLVDSCIVFNLVGLKFTKGLASFEAGRAPPNYFLFLSRFLFSKTAFLSKIWKPIKWNVSDSNIDLTCLSKGEELDKLGATLTSKSHGFKFASTRTSKPNTSKH